ncbi:reverse transcriptase domain-containing protein [Tanacetum coccineum]
MRTRSQARKRRQQQVRQTSVESPNLEKPNNNQEIFNPPIVTMDDNRTMAQLLEAPTEGYEDAIVVPEITANNFEIKHGLLNLVQNKQFFGHDKEDPHAHIRLKIWIEALILDKKNQTPAPAPVKAVEQKYFQGKYLKFPESGQSHFILGTLISILALHLSLLTEEDDFLMDKFTLSLTVPGDEPVPWSQRREAKKGGITVMLERLAGNEYYCFLDGFSGYFQIPIDPLDQEKTTFTCPYGTFAYRRMPFGLCNASGTFQRCMVAIFHDMIEKTMEVFMDDFSVFGDSFSSCLSHLDKMLQRCEDTNLVLNWEKCHFMVKEGIVLGHKISKSGIEVDKAKVDVIAKLPHPTTVKGIRSFLGHAGFYRRFIQDFSKIARPMTHLLEKETPFIFSKECIEAFETLKMKLTQAPILVAPDWDLPFEIMCDASDFAVGAVLGQRKTKHFQPIHYASKTMTEAQAHYTTTEKELLAVVYAFEKFRPYLVLSKSIVYTDHSALKYLLAKQDAKPRLLRWILLLQEFDVVIRDKKGAKNLAADHLSRLENPHQSELEKKEITKTFPLETLGMVTFRGNDNAPWFTDFANYHAGNFMIKGMSSQ